jgi:hypothetical protein
MSVRFHRGASCMLSDEVYIGGRIRASSARRDLVPAHWCSELTFRLAQSFGVGAEAGLLRATLGTPVAGTQHPEFPHILWLGRFGHMHRAR